MNDKEIQHAARNMGEVPVTRRKFLKYSGLTALSLSSISSAFIIPTSIGKGADAYLTEQGLPTKMEVDDAANEVVETLDTLLEDQRLEEVREYVSSDEFIAAEKSLANFRTSKHEYDRALDDFHLKNKTEQKLLTTLFLFFGGAVTLVPTAGRAATNYLMHNLLGKLARERIRNALSEHGTVTEAAEAVKRQYYLPPIGGKIMQFERNDEVNRGFNLEPTILAEEQVEKVIQLRRSGFLGEQHVHQMTIQGQLPDAFKYAALALITHSPFEHDWDTNFYDAPWGRIGPLIHDGGEFDIINPFWTSQAGRTDFLHRISSTEATGIDEVEDQEITSQLAQKDEDLEAIGNDHDEEERLYIDARFFQRAAFALHAKTGTVSPMMPESVTAQASQVWDAYVCAIKELYAAYDISCANAVWFYQKGERIPGWPGDRREGLWALIRPDLKQLEEKRWDNPTVIGDTRRIMIETSDAIDNIIFNT